MVNKITSYQTAENGKFIEILNNTTYPAISVVRLSYPDTSDAFPENFGLSPVSSVDVYSKYAVLTHLTNPEDIKISLSAENINVSLDELEYLVARSNSLVEVLTASSGATPSLSLLNALTANTDNIETLLDSLTALTQNEFEQTQTLLDSLTSLQEIKQNDIITLLNQLTANTDSIEVNTDEVESLIFDTNVLLNTLTAVDYSTETKQDVIITLLDSLTAKQTTINLDVSAINLNTDEIEGLIKTSNTLLDALTAKQTTTNVTGLETRLDVLTAVDYATSYKQDSIITLLDSLTAKQTTINLDVSAINLNTDEIEGLIEKSNTLLDVLTAKQTITDVIGIETRLDVLTAVDYATSYKQDQEISLLDSLTSINIRIPGFSIPPYDEISLNYYGLTNNIETVIYKNNTTTALSLSLGYAPNPPTSNDALLSSVKKF
jgi:hypothetical protein